MKVQSELQKLRQMFFHVDFMYELIEKVELAYIDNDIEGAFSLMSEVYNTFMEESRYYSLKELIYVNQCYMSVSKAYYDYIEHI